MIILQKRLKRANNWPVFDVAAKAKSSHFNDSF